MHILYSFISIFPPLFCLFTMCQTSRVKVPSADRQDVCTVWRRVRACEGTRSPSYKTLPEFRLTTFIRTRGRSLRRWTWEEKWTRFWVVPSQHTDDASSWSKWRWTQPEVSIWTIKIRAEVCDCNLNWSRFLHIHIIVVVWRHIFHLTIYTLFYFVLPESGRVKRHRLLFLQVSIGSEFEDNIRKGGLGMCRGGTVDILDHGC